MIDTEKLCPACMNDSAGEKICPICGYDSSSQNPDNCLPLRFTVANRYFIGAVKSINGEGITYAAWDTAKETPVNIREYFPLNFAVRNPDKTVSIVKGGEYTFNEGLMDFMDINRRVLECELPSVIPVTGVFEENGTVYAVSQSVACITMSKFLKKNGGTLKWEQARPLFLPLIDTVRGMNELGIIHGGISTETVLVGRDGKLRISGYGIKNLRLADSPLETEIYSGFAAIEQYGYEDMHIDAYTDVYGLAALLFTVLIGSVPTEAPLRLQNDSMSIPAKFAEELPRHVLSALANALQVLPKNRTENIEAFKNELVYAETAEPVKPKQVSESRKKESGGKPKKSGSTAKYVILSSVCTAVVFLGIVAILVFTVFRNDIFGGSSSSGSDSDLSVSAPVVDKIGTIDSGAEETATLYQVPSFSGKYYAEITESEDYEMFEFIIKDKEFSDKYSKGQICAQSLAEGSKVVRDTKIEVTISLGPKEIKIANVVGLDETAAKLELLKQGFLYENIEVLEKYDEDHEPGVVLEQEPKNNTKVNSDVAVKIYINSYTGNTDTETDTDSSY